MFKKFLLLTVVLTGLFSCKRDDKITLVESTGRINHLLVVMKNSDWDGSIGDSLVSILSKPLVGLPQEEAPFTITHVTPDNFSKLFNRNRNILFFGVSDKDNYYTNSNVYSSPQTTITILGKDEKSLIDNLRKHEKELIKTYKEGDLKLYQRKITKHHWDKKNVETFKNLGFSMKIPSTYNKVEDTGDFLWFRYPYSKGQMNIIGYAVPVKSEDDFNLLNIIKIRDSIGKNFIPGQFDNTFMTTEPLYTPMIKKLKLAGKEAIETRGLWYVENDFMGGPFISYTIYDKPGKRLIIIEGFVYSPATKKRDFVFELESILKTFSMK
jgi:hypothetical protein